MSRMDTPTDPDEARDTLKIDLVTGLTPGYPEPRRYIPRSCLRERVTRATIERCLPRAPDRLIDFVSISALKIFAILLYSGCLPRKISLESTLLKCKEKGITDAVLPLQRHTKGCVCSEDRAFCQHEVARNVLGNLYSWEQFYTHQWMFLGHEFETGVFDYELDEQIILPIRLRDGYNEGSFGEVREGELNQDHARRSESGGKPRNVAIKMFKNLFGNDHQGLAARRAWEMEAENIRELSEQNHPHLIHRIATVTHGKRFLILSDWADGGDLRNFWKQESTPSFNSTLVLEVVTQLRGLASAIKLMHHGCNVGKVSSSTSESLVLPTASTPVIIGVDTEADRAEAGTESKDLNWRHGDLKPENILRFMKGNETVGTLRISDLGLAKRHVVSTGLRKLVSSSQFGTADYEPPEAVTMRLSPRSRLYDIWSFGCVMLEFVVWLLYGQNGLNDFWNLPIEPEGTRFWSRLPVGVEPGAQVNPYVTKVMDSILATDATCQKPSAIRDLLLLVKDKVLLPVLPGVHTTIPPGHRRVQASELLANLEEIENKCKSPQYCCTNPPKRGARLPATSQLTVGNISDSLRLPPVTRGNGLANLQVPPDAARAQRVIPTG